MPSALVEAFPTFGRLVYPASAESLLELLHSVGPARPSHVPSSITPTAPLKLQCRLEVEPAQPCRHADVTGAEGLKQVMHVVVRATEDDEVAVAFRPEP